MILTSSRDRPYRDCKKRAFSMGRPRLPSMVLMVAWFLLATLSIPECLSAASPDEPDFLTREERVWLEEHEGSIRFAPSPTYAPVCFRDADGQFQGITMDYAQRMEAALGFQFKIIVCQTWNEILEKARAGEIDVVGNIQRTEERETFLRFTEPYVTIPNAIITRKEIGRSLSLDSMRGMRVAVVKGYATVQHLEENVPEIDLIRVRDNLEGLQAVSFGRIDAMVTDLAVASHIIQLNGITNLRVAGTVPEYTWRLSFASRLDWPILNRILAKALKTIPPGKRQEIRRRWISIEKPTLIYRDWRFYGAVGLTCLLGVLVAFVWTRTLRGMVSRRTDELRHSKENLHKSEEKYRRTVTGIADIVAVTDTEGVIQYITPNIEMYLEYTVEEVVGQHFSEFVYPDDREIAEMGFRTQMDGEGKPVEFRFTAKAGEPEWVSALGSMNKETGSFYSVLRNITEYKRAEESLRESEERFRAAFDSAQDCVLIWDKEYNYLYANQAAIDHVGTTPDKVIGRNIRDGLGHVPDFMHLWMSRVDKVFETGNRLRVQDEQEMLGRLYYTDSILSPIRDTAGNVISVCVVYRDVTELKRAEVALQRSEEQYRLLVENANDAIFIAQDGAILFPNPKTTDITGYSADELSNMPFTDIIHPEDRDLVIERHLKRLKGETPPSHYPFRIINKAGEELWIEINVALMTWEDQPATINIIRDITQQRQLEDKLRQSQKMESIGTLAGGIAHDFNNILFPIVGNTEMLLEDIPKDSSLRGNLNEVFNAAMRAKDLVKQILVFSRQDNVEVKLMKMQPVIKEALKLIRSTIPTSIEIKQYIKKDCGAIKADPTQIHQIVMNLATNAYHAMEDTGGELKVNLKEIELGKQDLPSPDMEPGPYACLIVADSGTGIDDNVIDKIFDPYFTTKEQGKGTGMGLAVIHGITQNAGGTIQVYSAPNQGTEFHVYLPVVKSISEQQAIQTKKPLLHGTERILLVDDEEAIVFMEKQMLERLGYQVVSRTGSIEALEVFRANPDKFDIVITDMAMPNMSGDKLAGELIKIRSDIPVVLCTGFSEMMSDEKAASLGIKGFLMKPIVMKDLSNVMRDVLNDKESSAYD